MTTVLLSARTYGEWSEGASYALVELTPERVDDLIEKIALASGISKVDSRLLSLEFWDACVQWVTHNEELEEALGDNDLVVLDEWPELLFEEKVECECCILVVYTDAVFWKAFVKHTNALVESAWLPIGTLEELRE